MVRRDLGAEGASSELRARQLLLDFREEKARDDLKRLGVLLDLRTRGVRRMRRLTSLRDASIDDILRHWISHVQEGPEVFWLQGTHDLTRFRQQRRLGPRRGDADIDGGCQRD